MKTILLYGELGKRFGRVHRLQVRTAAEAIRALKANFRDFENFLCSAHARGMGFRIKVGREPVRDYVEIHNPSAQEDVIRIAPVLMGSKDPFVQILVGAVLIAAAVAFSPALGPLALAVGSIGASMALGGVSQLLAGSPPAPRSPGAQDTGSYIFNGPANTDVQGRAIPVGYGRMIVGSAVISAGIETYEE